MSSKKESAEAADRNFVVVASRLPVDRVKGPDGRTDWQTSPGGLVTALEPVMREAGGAWIGWSGDAGPAPGAFEADGLHLVGLAVNKDERFLVCDVEFHLPQPSYTIDTFHHLQKTYPQNRYRLIIGSDNFLDLPSWKSHQNLIKEAKIIVYLRPGYPIPASTPEIEVLSPAQLDISSTKIRELIRI